MKKAESLILKEINRILEEKKGRILVGIAGVPGSGKTTLAKRFSKRVENSVFLPMDGFHFYKKELEQFDDPKEAFIRRGSEFTFDSKKFYELLCKVKDGYGKTDVRAPSFDHAVGDPVEDDILIKSSHQVILIEGNYVLLDTDYWEKITQIMDLKIFINIDIDKAMERLALRHISELKLTKEGAIKRIETNDKINAVLIDKISSPRADLIINSEYDESYV